MLCRRPFETHAALCLGSLLLVCASASAQEPDVTVFVRVNVVPMDTERVLREQTVVVSGEEIITIGPSEEVSVPAGASVIDGHGNSYLMPGLADMHVHLNIDPSSDFLRVFLAEGTTTIRNLNALPEHLRWQEDVRRGELIGPTIYTSGPLIVGPPDPSYVWEFRALVFILLLGLGALLWTGAWGALRARGDRDGARRMRRFLLPGALVLLALGVVLIWTKAIPIDAYTSLEFPFAYVPDTEEQARAEVRRQSDAGYDLIKVYDYLPRALYFATIEEAQARGIYIIGHLDHGVEAPLAAGLRELAHVDELLDEHLIGEAQPGSFTPLRIEHGTIPETVARIAEHDVMVVANLSADVVTYEYLEEGPAYFERPEYAILHPDTLATWRNGRMVSWQGQQEWRRNTEQPFLDEMTLRLHEAGVTLLAGTDTGTDGAVPSLIHLELERLVIAGLTPYEALRTATVNACLSVNRMGVDDRFGEVSPGHRADLVLLEANPLADISATRRRLGVMARGRWFERSELERLVSELSAAQRAR